MQLTVSSMTTCGVLMMKAWSRNVGALKGVWLVIVVRVVPGQQKKSLTTSFTSRIWISRAFLEDDSNRRCVFFFSKFLCCAWSYKHKWPFLGAENWTSVKGSYWQWAWRKSCHLPLRDRKTTPPSFKGGPACRLSTVGFWGGGTFFLS